MEQGLRGSGDPLRPHIYRTHIPYEPVAASDRTGNTRMRQKPFC